MLGKILTFASLFVAASIVSAASIPFNEAADHVGEEVTVTGKVSRVNTIPSGMTFVNFGPRGPGSFTVVARPGVPGIETLKDFQGKAVEVRGTIELYDGNPQIVITSSTAIRLPGGDPPADDPAPAEEQPDPAPSTAEYEIRTFEVPLERKEIRDAGKAPDGEYPVNATVAVAHPPGFKPSPDQRLLVLFTDYITGPDHEKLIGSYLKVAAREKLFVITARGPAIDSKLSAEWYPTMLGAAFRHLGTEFPGIGKWPLYLAGMRDGATNATISSGALLKADFNIKGIFLTSLKKAEFEKSIDAFRPSRTEMRELKVFVAYGTGDRLVTKDTSLQETQRIRDAGFDNVRHEVNDGWGGPQWDSLDTAIKWFDETGE